MDIDIASSPADRIASFGAGQLIMGTSDYRRSFSGVGFQTHWESDHRWRVCRAGLLDRFAAAGPRSLESRGMSGAHFRDLKPNHALQATPVGAGLEVLSRRPGVPELGRWEKQL